MFLLFIITTLLVFQINLTSSEPTLQSCPNGWKQFRNKCFMFYMDKSFVNFYEAHIICKDFFDSTLVSIHSVEEQNFLTKFAFNTNRAQNHVWIGARRTSNDTFVWEDKSPFDYTNWAKTQPNNLEGKHFCASLLQSPNVAEMGNWYDDPCADKYNFICQKYLIDSSLNDSFTHSNDSSVSNNVKNPIITFKELKSIYNKTLIGNSSTISALIASNKEEQHYSHTNTILIVVTIVQFVVIVSLIFILFRKHPMFPPYRTLVMSECSRNTAQSLS